MHGKKFTLTCFDWVRIDGGVVPSPIRASGTSDMCLIDHSVFEVPVFIKDEPHLFTLVTWFLFKLNGLKLCIFVYLYGFYLAYGWKFGFKGLVVGYEIIA